MKYFASFSVHDEEHRFMGFGSQVIESDIELKITNDIILIQNEIIKNSGLKDMNIVLMTYMPIKEKE